MAGKKRNGEQKGKEKEKENQKENENQKEKEDEKRKKCKKTEICFSLCAFVNFDVEKDKKKSVLNSFGNNETELVIGGEN